MEKPPPPPLPPPRPGIGSEFNPGILGRPNCAKDTEVVIKNNGKLATITRLILRILKTPILATLQIIDILIKHP
jgi:hypothetical protein